MSASGGARPQEMKTSMRQEMNMTWDVQGVDEKSGEAVIRQKFDRVKMKMSTPVGGFEYDSKSEEAPTGLGAMIAPMYKAMTEGEFEITMTSRGEVKDVKIPEASYHRAQEFAERGCDGRHRQRRGFQEDDFARRAGAAEGCAEERRYLEHEGRDEEPGRRQANGRDDLSLRRHEGHQGDDVCRDQAAAEDGI